MSKNKLVVTFFLVIAIGVIFGLLAIFGPVLSGLPAGANERLDVFVRDNVDPDATYEILRSQKAKTDLEGNPANNLWCVIIDIKTDAVAWDGTPQKGQLNLILESRGDQWLVYTQYEYFFPYYGCQP